MMEDNFNYSDDYDLDNNDCYFNQVLYDDFITNYLDEFENL